MTGPFDAIAPVPGPVERDKAKARLKGRRERQQRTAGMRRQHLLDAAWSLLVEVGPQSFNMRDLGERAGYTAGALYSYFPSRDHLIGELRQRLLVSLADRVGRAFKQGKKAAAADQPRVEGKSGRAEAAPEEPPQDVFERCTLTWWQALSSDSNALALLLTGQGACALELQDSGSEKGHADLLAELSTATQACALALEEAGLTAAQAWALQQQILCFGVGLLVMQQPSMSTSGGRKLVSRRFVKTVQTWRTKVPGEENGGLGEGVEAEDAQVGLF